MATLNQLSKTDEFFGRFFNFLEDEIGIKSREIVERHKQEMISEIEQMRHEVLASAAVRLSHRINIETFGTTLRIELVRPEGKKP